MTPAPETAPITAPVPTALRVRHTVSEAFARVRDSGTAITQIVIAVTASYAFAHFVLGHQAPLLAATVTVSSLGLVRDARPRRVVETVLGMLVGILVAELVHVAAGAGWWQLGLALALTLVVARLLSPQPTFAIAAAIQSIIVIMIAEGAPFTRLVDGMVGGAAAILVTILVPRSATRAEIRDGRAVFEGMQAAGTAVVQALRRGDRFRAERGLEKARALEPSVAAWRASLGTGLAVARISPFLRRQRSELQRHERVLQSSDFAVRNLRVVARRAVYLVDDGTPHAVAADLLGELLRAAGLIVDALDDISLEPVAREAILAVASRLDPRELVGGVGDQNLVAALRPLAVDLLTATGMSSADARAAVPRF